MSTTSTMSTTSMTSTMFNPLSGSERSTFKNAAIVKSFEVDFSELCVEKFEPFIDTCIQKLVGTHTKEGVIYEIQSKKILDVYVSNATSHIVAKVQCNIVYMYPKVGDIVDVKVYQINSMGGLKCMLQGMIDVCLLEKVNRYVVGDMIRVKLTSYRFSDENTFQFIATSVLEYPS